MADKIISRIKTTSTLLFSLYGLALFFSLTGMVLGLVWYVKDLFSEEFFGFFPVIGIIILLGIIVLSVLAIFISGKFLRFHRAVLLRKYDLPEHMEFKIEKFLTGGTVVSFCLVAVYLILIPIDLPLNWPGISGGERIYLGGGLIFMVAALVFGVLYFGLFWLDGIGLITKKKNI